MILSSNSMTMYSFDAQNSFKHIMIMRLD